MAALVEEATDRPREQVKKDLCRALGYVDYEVDQDGSVHVWPKSIAVESMPQRDFDDFFRKGIEVMAGWIGADAEGRVAPVQRTGGRQALRVGCGVGQPQRNPQP